MNEFQNVLRKVSELMAGNDVVTVEEIKRNTYRALLSVFLSNHVDCGRVENLVSQVVESFCDEPASISSLYYSEELKAGDLTFRHLHTCSPSKENLEDAYERYIKSKKFLDSLEIMEEVTDKFFNGYGVESGLIRIYTKGKYRYGVYYSIIEDVGEDIEIHEKVSESFDGEYVVVVPTEDEITKFLKFFTNYSERVKKAGFKMWVVNVKEKTIDPFIGYPKDFTLLKGFKNPRIASQINSLWRVHVESID